MPWTTPSLRQVREMVRDDVTAALSGAVLVGNSVLRVMSDAKAGLAHLTLRYIDWLARQLLPDTAETEWLDRHGDIWLVNADSSTGRKQATYATGTINVTGTDGTILPIATQFQAGTTFYETTAQITISDVATPVDVICLEAGIVGNLTAGDKMTLVAAIANVDSSATVVTMTGGTDAEIDDDLRLRVLERIRQPPMGGDETDYIAWAKAFAGVTRAWSYPKEMGMGTVTVRFMMDDLRSDDDGFPNSQDVLDVKSYIDTVRPVAVKDFFVEAPVAYGIDFSISGLSDDRPDVRASIEASVKSMLHRKGKPGQTIYRSWIDEAVSAAIGEEYHELIFATTTMPDAGKMPVLGTITYL